ncbi:MAG: hypothetical protein JXL80_10475, partial [Planctomycetes bacterium]|nr:hypothetical protein [Planctomycetota bacterium]
EMTTLWEMRSTNPIVGWPGVVASAQYAWNSKAIAPSQVARRVAAHLHGPEAARDVARTYAQLSSDVFFDRYMDERRNPPIPGCRTYHLDSHEFVSTDPFVYLTYRDSAWAGRVIRQAARGIESVAAARSRARWADDDLDVCQLAGMHQAMHGQQRQTINRVGRNVVRAERLRRQSKTKQAAAVLAAAAAELTELSDFADALMTGTVDVWQRTRHGNDPALEEIYLRRLRLTREASKRTAAKLRCAADRLRSGRSEDLGRIIGGDPVLVFEVTNPSRTLIDIFTPEIAVTSDGRRWTTVNTKGWFFLERQRYLTAVTAPGGRLPRRIRVHVRRTHINPASFPPAERFAVRTARTLTPEELIGRPPAADVETPDWRLVWTPQSAYALRSVRNMVLEYELSGIR